MTKYFKRVQTNKAKGPDGIYGRTLEHCAEELNGVFQRLFQLSVDSGIVPDHWKNSIIIPISKTSRPKVLNDLRPIVLTSLVMKTLEKIVKSHIMDLPGPALDPLQFAYKPGRGVDDAKLFLLASVHEHLERTSSYVRLLFVDFSSAFNTMQPHVLVEHF